MTEPDPAAFLRLLTWTSPAFPTGAFAYSHGLEVAVEDGLVKDRHGLAVFVDAALRFGAGRSDAIFTAAAWRTPDDDDLLELAAVLRATSELADEQAAQGSAALRALRAAWPHPALDGLDRRAREFAVEPPLSIVNGIAGRAHGLDLATLLRAVVHGFAANLVSAGVRLIPLGQTDGLRTLAALESTVLQVAAEALTSGPDDLGGCAVRIDLLSALHETQYTRLFRS